MQTILAALILAIVTALISSFLTYYFTSKKQKNEAILKFREEKYAELLLLLEGFVGQTASSETKKAFFREQHKSWLYSSDEVTRAINHMIKLVANHKGMIKTKDDPVGNIVLAMRKDLLGKTSLTSDEFKYIDVIEDTSSVR
jgi:hypothetical protein